MFMPRRPGTSRFRFLVTGSSESLTTRIPGFGMVIPKVSTSSSKYPMYGIFNPLAAVNVNQPLVDRRFLPLGWKLSLKKLSVMVDTSDPESRRHGTRTPPSLTFAIGHFPRAQLKMSSLLGTSSGEPVLFPPVTRLIVTGGASLTGETSQCLVSSSSALGPFPAVSSDSNWRCELLSHN